MTTNTSSPLFDEGHLIFVRRFFLIVTPMMFIWHNWGYTLDGIGTLVSCAVIGHWEIPIDTETPLVYEDIEALSKTASNAIFYSGIAAIIYWTFYKLAPIICDTQRELVRKQKRRSRDMKLVLREAEILNQLKESQTSEIELRRLLADVTETLHVQKLEFEALQKKKAPKPQSKDGTPVVDLFSSPKQKKQAAKRRRIGFRRLQDREPPEF